MDKFLFIFLLAIAHLRISSGWKSLMKRIPNADHVRNPCNKNEAWEGVGHLKPEGYGRRNQFGIDFNKHDKVWTRELCMLDSDGDGRTNGQELGDPECTWVMGTVIPDIDPINISHPGICEPLDSAKCKTKNVWLTCSEPEFNCPAIEKPDTKNFTVTFPKHRVPIQETTHKCMLFEFPTNGDFHMVATKPFIDNKKVMHHITVFGCDDNKTPEYKLGEVYECGFAFDPACRDLLSVWLLGMDGECMHENTGFRIGNQGYKRGGIQIHWENQQLVDNEFDGSGVTVFYTDQLRLHDAGVLFIGQQYMNIPPRKEHHVEVGHCYPECTKRKWSDDLHITVAVNHMHYLGDSMKIEHIRNDEVINVITDEQNYDYDSPIMHAFNNPVVLSPGDELRTTCVYDSTSRDVTTRAGSGYREEMCFGFLTFYPKQAVNNGDNTCTSWKELPFCRFELDATVDGCDFKNVRNLSNPATKEVYEKVTKHCRPFGPCYEDCRQVVKDITTLPCYHGDLWEWQRDKIGVAFDNTTATADWYRFYAAIDSCLLSQTDLRNINNSQNDQVNNSGLMLQTGLCIYYMHLCFIISIFVCSRTFTM